jgi:Ni,Fe-hydrogenase III small subunit/ferredoxin-like protein FixX
MSWFLRGLRTGILTEKPPDSGDVSPGLSPGLPQATMVSTIQEASEAASHCPTRALESDERIVNVNADRCVECMRCKSTQNWRRDTLWAHTRGREPLEERFKHSIHVRIVDAGDCGACLNELSQLNGPSYNLHRFGIFITPTPRQADVLLVVGPVTRQMLDPLKLAYEAMPSPKRVLAVGACAASGGVFGPSVMCAAGVAEAVKVDLVVPGCPPPPLAIVHALRALCGQERLP